MIMIESERPEPVDVGEPDRDVPPPPPTEAGSDAGMDPDVLARIRGESVRDARE